MHFFTKKHSQLYPPQTYSYSSGLTLCFDLDGTLVDTAPDLIRVLNLVIAQEGLPETNYKAIRKLIGYGSRRMITEALSRENHNLSEQRIDELRNLFLKLYAEDIAQLSRPFPGVIDTLRHWQACGVNLRVCTNKPGYLARPLLEALNLDIYFDDIIGGDEAPKPKPDPRHIWAAASHRESSRIVMVGDAYPDIRAAHNARAPSILMRYGYTPISLMRLKADVILSDFRQIPTALKTLSHLNLNKNKV
ncbi:MAG: HAD-IA family hydrolase [Litorimonas sp.]